MSPTGPIDRNVNGTSAEASRRVDRRLSAIRPMARRGLSRTEAALYVGIGVTKFDALVEQGRMPKPKRIDSRRIWDIFELDLAFDELQARMVRQMRPGMTLMPRKLPPFVERWHDRHRRVRVYFRRGKG